MKKKDAISLFGNVMKTAAALGVSHPAVSHWPDVLPLAISDRVRGAAVRVGRRLPPHLKTDEFDHVDPPARCDFVEQGTATAEV